ncbi:Glutamate receptor ionotropic, delta-2, partial [Araneus ventricosus]
MVNSPKIKVAVLPIPEIMEINRSEHGIIKLSGYEGKFLQSILTKMDMEYEIVVPEDRQWGLQQDNGSWTGLIGMIERGEADMACTFLAMTDQRMEAVDFSSSYALEVYTFATHMPDSYKSNFAILHPFQATVWICLCGILVMTSIVYAQLQERKTSPGRIFYKLLASILKQPQEMHDKTRESSSLLLMWSLFALIISLSYSATLLSFVMLPSKEHPISTIHELSEAVQGGSHQCIASKDGSELMSLRNSKEDYLSKLGNIIYRNKWFVNSSSINSEYFIRQGRSQLIYKNLAKLLFGAREDISISEDSLMSRPLAIALNRKFCCKSDLNSAIS